MADIHILVADDSAGQRLDAYLGANDGCPTRSACAHLIEAVPLPSTARPACQKSMPCALVTASRSTYPSRTIPLM